jgi:hypothetical protein
MNNYNIVDGQELDGKLTAIADAIRYNTGKSDSMTLEQMQYDLIKHAEMV